MAELILGIGTSHGPLLSTPANMWHLRADADRKNRELHYHGQSYDFDGLIAARGRTFDNEASLENRERCYNECQIAIERLAKVWEETKPDIAVIFGNDQREIFAPENTPAISMVYGEELDHKAIPAARLEKMDPGIAVAARGSTPESDQSYPSPVDLNAHLFEHLMEAGFDVSALKRLPVGPKGREGLPHAYGFVYRRIMQSNIVPVVLICFNTFYPPNQPTAKRCFDFGQAVGNALLEWGEDKRIAIVGSGGLSHFVVDEPFDEEFLTALTNNDYDYLSSIPESYLQGGTSECKNWIGAAGALSVAGLKLSGQDYVPCYRSEGGTGNAQGFLHWR